MINNNTNAKSFILGSYFAYLVECPCKVPYSRQGDAKLGGGKVGEGRVLRWGWGGRQRGAEGGRGKGGRKGSGGRGRALGQCLQTITYGREAGGYNGGGTQKGCKGVGVGRGQGLGMRLHNNYITTT